jgi:hypothetical protein
LPSPSPTNDRFFSPASGRVITAVTALDPATGKRASIYVHEDAPWSAVRDEAHSHGFAVFTVDPGDQAGGITTIEVTYYNVIGPQGELVALETFTLQRPRSDEPNR